MFAVRRGSEWRRPNTYSSGDLAVSFFSAIHPGRFVVDDGIETKVEGGPFSSSARR